MPKRSKPLDGQDEPNTPENRFQNLGVTMFGVFTVLTFAHYYFQPATIGHDPRIFIFIILLPAIVGVAILGYYRRDFLRKQFSDDKTFVGRAVMVVFYIVEGLIFSYLSIVQLAGIGWDIANYNVAKNATPVVIECPADGFSPSNGGLTSRNTVGIIFEGKYESIVIDGQLMAQYKNEDFNNYKVVMTVQQGLWNHYTVNHLTIRKKISASY